MAATFWVLALVSTAAAFVYGSPGGGVLVFLFWALAIALFMSARRHAARVTRPKWNDWTTFNLIRQEWNVEQDAAERDAIMAEQRVPCGPATIDMQPPRWYWPGWHVEDAPQPPQRDGNGLGTVIVIFGFGTLYALFHAAGMSTDAAMGASMIAFCSFALLCGLALLVEATRESGRRRHHCAVGDAFEASPASGPVSPAATPGTRRIT